MEKKKLAFISGDRYFNKMFREYLSEESFIVHPLDSFAHAREELSKTKYDVIFLDIPGLAGGLSINNELFREYEDSPAKLEFFGRKLMGDVIRKENSINFKTPLNVYLNPVSFFNPLEYIKDGANRAFIKVRESYAEMTKVMKKQVDLENL